MADIQTVSVYMGLEGLINLVFSKIKNTAIIKTLVFYFIVLVYGKT